MAIGDDFSVAVNGDIRHVSGTTTYTVLQLHRWLQDLADDAEAGGNDLIDITSDTPSERSTDNIITLNAPYNIDDTAAEFLYAGSITQDGGDTVYSGLQVLGAVNTALTQLYVIQNNKLYPYTTDPTAPFWGDQEASDQGLGSLAGYNGDPTNAVLMRIMLKTRVNGADIDGKRIRVQARHWGDTYDFFNVTLGQGESVAAISTTPDAQNDTGLGTVTAYTHVTNSGGTANAPTGGYQTIDLNNGNGALEYYSAWTYGADTSGDGLKGLWEYIKELSGHGSAPIDAQDETNYDNTGNNGTFVGGDGAGGTAHVVSDVLTMSDGTTITVDAVDGNGDVTQFTVDNAGSQDSLKPGDVLTQDSSTGTGDSFTLTIGSNNLVAQKTIDSLDGQLFLGVTHSSTTAAPSGAFTEREVIAWGTSFAYDGGTTMNTPAVGDRIVFSGGAGGQITYTTAGATTGTLYVMLDSGEAAPADPETFICYNTSGSNVGDGQINGAVGTDGGGGTALLLADDTTDDIFYYQLLTGTAPGNSKTLIGASSGQTAVTSAVASAQTVPKTFLGSYTGSLIGAYGVGVTSTDLTASDTITPLVGATQTPPNNVTFTVTGLVYDDASNFDRVLVGPRSAGVLQKNQFAVTNGPLVSGSTTVEIDVAIPTDTPSAGNIRVENDSGVYQLTTYTSYTGNVFTLSGTYGGAAANTNNVFVSYIDANVLVNTTSLSFTSVYLADRDLFVRVRDGGSTPIKTFEAPATLGSSGGSIAAIRTTDA